MLKITRRTGERIIVGDDIVVTLLEISGQTARIGIDAPRSIPVFREEIWVEVKRENEAVAGAAEATLPAIATDGTPAPVGQSGLTVTTD